MEVVCIEKDKIDNKAKIDEIISLLKSLKQLKDIELGKQNEKLVKFENVKDLLKSIKEQNENIKELNTNINELIKQNGEIINRLTSIANSNWGNMLIISVVLMSINYSFISRVFKNIYSEFTEFYIKEKSKQITNDKFSSK